MRAHDAQELAIKTAETAGLASTVLMADLDPMAMPRPQLPTVAAGDSKPQAQRNFIDP